MTRKKVILVLLDACRGDYINKQNTPYLYELSKQSHYYKTLVPSFGFCERTEILVGEDGESSGYFTAFGYDEKKSPYNSFSTILSLLGVIENKLQSAFFSKLIRRIIWEIFKKKDGTYYPARIPLSELSNFILTEDGKNNLIDKSDDSIYNLAKNVFYGATTSLDKYLKGSDEDRLNLVLNALDKKYDFYPTYVSLLDGIGHIYGPNSKEIKQALRIVDTQIEKFITSVTKKNQNVSIVLCGDHGMSSVKSYVDLTNIFEELIKKNLINKNTKVFFDSTMARFWFHKKDFSSKKIIKNAINKKYANMGYFVEKDEYKKHGIPSNRMYGDLIWLCNEGVILSPDFFTPKDKSILGMHGYKPTDNQHYGFCLIVNSDKDRRVYETPQPLTVVYDELKNFFIDRN